MSKPSDEAKARKKRAQRRGRWAEALARLYLRMSGWRILGANVVTPVGEIDIIAKRGALIAFIEVKARSSSAVAAAAIGSSQQQRIARAAEAFLAQRPALHHCDIRFDAILISGPLTLQHQKDAWRP